MSRLRLFSRQARICLLAGAGWLALHAVALAQAANKAAEKKESSATTGAGAYVFAYLLLILAIALGMLVVTRSSGRRDRARPEAYAESTLLDQIEDKKPQPKKK